MIRNWISLGAAVGILSTCSGAVRADDRKDIEALYGKLTMAIKDMKPENTLSLEAPGFVSMEPDGSKLSGQQVVQQMKKENEDVKSVKSTTIKIKSCAIKGKTAKVVTMFSFSAVVVDRSGHMGKKGATHAISESGEVTNDLVKTPDGWKFLTMAQAAGTVTMDGKPMKMPAGAAKTTKKKM